jgi:hypothetical protein
MRDCSACPFNVGLVFKSLQALAKVDRPVNLEFQRAQFVARIQEVNYA